MPIIKLRSKVWNAFKNELPSQENKVLAITGSTSGTGLRLALTVAELKGRCILLNRASERADAALALVEEAAKAAGAPPPLAIECDLSSLKSTRSAGKAVAAACAESGLDVLACNAGIMGFKDLATADGFDVQVQTNCLGHYVLVAECMAVLEQAGELRGEARIVHHSSALRVNPNADWNQSIQEKFFRKNGGNLGGDGPEGGSFGNGPYQRYQQTKLANLCITRAIHERLEAAGSKVRAYTAHPGVAATDLMLNTSAGGERMPRLVLKLISWLTMQSIEDGTMGLAKCCLESGLQPGGFYGPRGPPKSYKSFKGKEQLRHNTKEYKGKAVLMPDEPLATSEAATMLFEVMAEETEAKVVISRHSPRSLDQVALTQDE